MNVIRALLARLSGRSAKIPAACRTPGRVRILIIEYEDGEYACLEWALSVLGWDCARAAGRIEAMHRIISDSPEIIVTNIMMGMGIILGLRERGLQRPVVLLSRDPVDETDGDERRHVSPPNVVVLQSDRPDHLAAALKRLAHTAPPLAAAS